LADDPEIRRLYGVSLAEFIAARNALATRLRKAGQQEEAQTVKALKKPTPPVKWCSPQSSGAPANASQRESSSGGTFPPFSASFLMTSLCSHMFIVAVSPVSPE
jgi:hypothetical protein